MSHVVLQPGLGNISPGHYLPATPQNVLWGRLPCAADAAVLSIGSGDVVTIDTLSHEGLLEDQGRDPLAFFAGHGVAAEDVLTDAVALAASAYPRDAEADGPHVVTGPIEVRGALPGDLLRMTLLEATPRVPYGVISSRHGRGALPGEYPVAAGTVSVFSEVETDLDFEGSADSPDGGADSIGRALFGTLPLVPGGETVVRFPLDPFLGIMGVAVSGDTRPHSVPPGAHGGNLDISLLTAGSALYLPVQVPGALAYVGDPHFAQGDGEVALTALEASLRVRIRFDIIPAAEAEALFGSITGPLAETGDYLVPTGLDPDLNEALRACVRSAIALLGARYGMDRSLAYAYLSAATDFTISQVVDRVTGVHARIRTADFGG